MASGDWDRAGTSNTDIDLEVVPATETTPTDPSRARRWPPLRVVVPLVLVATVAALIFALWPRDEPGDAPAASHPTPSSPPLTPTPRPPLTRPSREPGPARPDNTGDFENGHQFVRLRGFDPLNRTVTFDAALWFSGDEAYQAVLDDGGTQDDFNNDYYLRDVNPKLRTLPLDADVGVLLIDSTPADNSISPRPATLDEFAAHLRDPVANREGEHHFGFWIEIRQGRVFFFEEQYNP